jgi:hypothetical protein
LILQLPNLAVK